MEGVPPHISIVIQADSVIP